MDYGSLPYGEHAASCIVQRLLTGGRVPRRRRDLQEPSGVGARPVTVA
jgi:hypothetical protein